jgi:hypothetical protein
LSAIPEIKDRARKELLLQPQFRFRRNASTSSSLISASAATLQIPQPHFRFRRHASTSSASLPLSLPPPYIRFLRITSASQARFSFLSIPIASAALHQIPQNHFRLQARFHFLSFLIATVALHPIPQNHFHFNWLVSAS